MTALWLPRPARRIVVVMDITNSTVFMPGATSGIGLALALRLQQAGSTVVVGGRRQALLDSIAAEHGLDTVQVDVADAESIQQAAETVLAAHPALDTLVTMSGIMRNEDLRDPAHISDAVEIVETNLVGTIRLIDAFLPHLLGRPSATVMTVSSGLAFVPLTATPTYSATKAGVHAYTQALRQQLVGSSVEVLEPRAAGRRHRPDGWAGLRRDAARGVHRRGRRPDRVRCGSGDPGAERPAAAVGRARRQPPADPRDDGFARALTHSTRPDM